MSLLGLLVLAGVAACAAGMLQRLAPAPAPRLVFALGALLAGAWLCWWSGREPPQAQTVAPAAGVQTTPPPDGYATSAACRSCHPAEYQSWHQSYHRSMT